MTYHHLYTLFSYHIQTDTHASTLKIYILYDEYSSLPSWTVI